MIYSIKQGIKGLLSTKAMSFLSIISVSASLIILSLVMGGIFNVNEFIEYTKNEVNEIRVSITLNLDDENRKAVKDKMQKVDGVESIRYKSKERAFDEMKENWEDEAYLLEGIENPLDDYYIVTIKDSNEMKSIVSELQKIENVIGVDYHQDIMNNFLKISETIKKFGSLTIIFLFMICLVLISNTIKSRVYSKKEEIEIIKCFGGSNLFITAPFIVEGFFIGFFGAVFSSIGYVLIYKYISENINTLLSSISTSMLLKIEVISAYIIPTLLLSGVIIGVLGSIISVKKYLKI